MDHPISANRPDVVLINKKKGTCYRVNFAVPSNRRVKDERKRKEKVLGSCQLLARRPDLVIANREKRTCRIVDLTVSAGYKVKLKENERKDKYLDLGRELKKLWNMKVAVIPIVNSGFSAVTARIIKLQHH